MINFLWLYYRSSIAMGLGLFLLGGFVLLFSLWTALLLMDLIIISTFFWIGVSLLGLSVLGTVSSLVTTVVLRLRPTGKHRGRRL